LFYGERLMAEITQAVALELLRPILDFFMHADERQAVKTANTLRFWRDGMLGHLEKIRDGEATDETFVALERFENIRERGEKGDDGATYIA